MLTNQYKTVKQFPGNQTGHSSIPNTRAATPAITTTSGSPNPNKAILVTCFSPKHTRQPSFASSATRDMSMLPYCYRIYILMISHSLTCLLSRPGLLAFKPTTIASNMHGANATASDTQPLNYRTGCTTQIRSHCSGFGLMSWASDCLVH